MAEIAVSVALVVLGQTSSIVRELIVKEGSRLSRLQEEISWVEREMRHIQSYLKHVEHKQGNNEGLANLIRDIRGIAFDVEDTMEKYFFIPSKKDGFKGFFKRFSHIFSDIHGARNILNDIESIKIRVEDIKRVRRTYDIQIDIEYSGHASRVESEGWDERRSYPHGDDLNITGFEDHIENLIAKINNGDSGLRVISITGMAGLGKTTLAKKVYKSVYHDFDVMAWVYVSEQPNIKNMLKEIARQLMDSNVTKMDDFVTQMHDYLMDKRYIIVFDDIWHNEAWDAIQVAIPINNKKDNRIILTSRDKEVGIYVGGRNSLFELQPLGNSNSKLLFETSIGVSQTEIDPPGLKEIGKSILRKCGGLPLAIIVMAGLLKVKERSESAWNGVLNQMDQSEGKLSKSFGLSYTDLPANLKPCFLYFGLFSEGHEIETFDLINLWAAEGFIKGTKNSDVEDVGYIYLNHLITRYLIQVVRKDINGKVLSCRIHDILRSLCIKVAKDIIFFTDLTNYNGEPVRRVAIYGNSTRDHISFNRQTPKLRSILWYSDGKKWNSFDTTLLRNFCKKLKLLRVLYLQIYSIPTQHLNEIWSLRNLTYLKLEISDMKENPHIPESIINLESLLTLDVKYWGHLSFRIPMIIWNMKRLRHILLPIGDTYGCKGFEPEAIDFQNFKTLDLPYEFIQADWLHKLSNLATLKIKIRFDPKIGNLLLTSNLVLNKLEILKIQVRYNQLHIRTLNLFGCQNLSDLSLYWVKIERWPQPNEFPPNLTTIILDSCDVKEDPLKFMEKIPKLRVLKLIKCRSPKMVCTGEPGNFPQLEHLTIAFVHIIFQCAITIKDGGMPRLREFLTAPRLKLPPRFDGIQLPWTSEGFDRNRRDLEVMIDKLMINSVFLKVFGPFIRQVVREEIELTLDKHEYGIVLSGKHISGKDGTNLKLELVDANTKLLVKLWPEASARVKLVLLRVDPESNNRNKNKWSSEQFNQNESLLIGDKYLKLNEGTGLVGNLYFPHREKWNRNCQYMLGAKFEDFDGINVIESISPVFTL